MSAQPASPARPASLNQPGIERGMLLMAAGILTVPGVHAIAKILGAGGMSAGQISWSRFFFQLAFLTPFIWIANGGRIASPSPSLALRGVLMATVTLSFFWALMHMPLANATAIFFVEPLLLTLISGLFLGETIGWRRITAVAVGFVGAMMVIRPSFDAVGVAALLPLVTALSYAAYVAITRHVAGGETAFHAHFWVSIFAGATLALALAVGDSASVDVLRLSWPSLWEAGMLVAMGLVAVISHRLCIEAYRRVPAGILAPLQYGEIVGSILLGLLVFGHVPDRLTALGTAIIVGSGLYVFHRERMVARRQG